MFGVGTQITAAITAVTLGRNLSNDNGELEGELIIGPTSGNIHIPILYSLYCVMAKKLEEATSNLRSAESSYTYLFPKDEYDLTVDTSIMTPAECSAKIYGTLL